MDEKISLPSLTVAWKANPPSVAMRCYLSTHHLWAARHFAQLAAGIEAAHTGRSVFDIRHRGYVVGAVLCAVAFIEAAINELFQDVVDSHESYVTPLDARTKTAMAAYWRESNGRGGMLEKYQLALALAGCEPVSTGGEPYQSAAQLVRLRNILVHFRPETVSIEDEHKMDAQLQNRFEPNKLMLGAQNPYFPDKALGAGCAMWAVDSAKSLADEAFGRLGVQPNYQRVEF